MAELDALDLALLSALRENPRAGVLALSRLTRVARATVQARLDRMEAAGVITGYGPDLDVVAAGFPVHAFVTLEIAQGALEQVTADLTEIPGVLEAYAITGSGDVLCKVAAASNTDLQQTLLRIDSSPAVARSTSAIVLSVVIGRRDLPLLESRPAARTSRSPAFRLRGVDAAPRCYIAQAAAWASSARANGGLFTKAACRHASAQGHSRLSHPVRRGP